MMVLFLVSAPISFLNVLNEIAALDLAGGGANFLSVIDAHQRDALAYLFLNLHDDGNMVAQIFWGLWLFPLGLLVWRSGFIPRVIGALVMASGVGYLIGAAATLVAPRWLGGLDSFSTVLETGEPVLVLWLVAVGARGRAAGAVPAT